MIWTNLRNYLAEWHEPFRLTITMTCLFPLVRRTKPAPLDSELAKLFVIFLMRFGRMLFLLIININNRLLYSGYGIELAEKFTGIGLGNLIVSPSL